MNILVFSAEELDEMSENDSLDFSINDEIFEMSGLADHPRLY